MCLWLSAFLSHKGFERGLLYHRHIHQSTLNHILQVVGRFFDFHHCYASLLCPTVLLSTVSNSGLASSAAQAVTSNWLKVWLGLLGVHSCLLSLVRVALNANSPTVVNCNNGGAQLPEVLLLSKKAFHEAHFVEWFHQKTPRPFRPHRTDTRERFWCAHPRGLQRPHLKLTVC